MYVKSAAFYDAFYSFRDYPAGAAAVTALVRARAPRAASLLDVACGTGLHLQRWREDFEVEGLDLSGDLLATARDRVPGVRLHQADMTDFDLGRTFDVVTCLFSAIAYVETVENMRRAIACMARHLNPGGLLLVEPWFTPETYWVDDLVANHVDHPDLKISWMYVSARRDRLSLLDIHFQVGTRDGVEQFRELHRMGLFTDEEHAAAFRAVGLEPEHLRDDVFGRGLHVGHRVA